MSDIWTFPGKNLQEEIRRNIPFYQAKCLEIHYIATFVWPKTIGVRQTNIMIKQTKCPVRKILNSLRPSDAYMRRKLTIIGSDNGRRQAIIWTNAGILLIEPLGTNFSEILIGIQIF